MKVVVPFLRALRGWNQKQLAEASGVDKALISQYENGKKVPSRRTLEKLLAAVGLPYSLFEHLLPFIRVVRGVMERGVPDDKKSALESDSILQSVNDAVTQVIAEALGGLSLLEHPEREEAIRSARLQAVEQWRRLSQRPLREQRLLVEGARELQTWALCERLCVESESAAASDPGRGLELAELALRVAVRVPGSAGSRSRLQGYAWAYVGHARRAAGDLSAAHEAFARARTQWTAGAPGDEGALEERRFLDLTGPLHEE